MVARVQRVDGEYRVVLSQGDAEAMRLTEGSAVEIQPAVSGSRAGGRGIQYASVEEVMDAFGRTEPLHRNTYKALAE